jgi:hypothetical protein
MAAVNDVIQATLITEQGGVQMSNTVYFEIDNLGSDPPLGEAALDILTSYGDTAKIYCAASWRVACIVMENMTTPEGRTIVQNTISGVAIGAAHGPDQVLRINQYANQADFLKIHRGWFNQSGIEHALSKRGRWNHTTDFSTLISWFSSTVVLGSNWTLTPNLRWQLTPGPPPTYAYTPVIRADYSARCFKLGSRKSSLCGAS